MRLRRLPPRARRAAIKRSVVGSTKAHRPGRGLHPLISLALQAMDQWDLSVDQRLTLLGIPRGRVGVMTLYRRGERLRPTPHLVERAMHVFAIYRCLVSLFPRNPELWRGWITAPHQAFAGKPPIALASEAGVPGLRAVRSYLEMEMNR